MDPFEPDVWKSVALASEYTAEKLNAVWDADTLLSMSYEDLAVIVARLLRASRLPKWKWPRILRCWEV